jgi:hypothetical protein
VTLRSPVLALGVFAALAVPSHGSGAARTGAVQFSGTSASDRSLRSVESDILRGGLESAASIVTRTGVHLFVAESEQAWNQEIAPGLNAALGDGPAAVARFADGLPPSIAQAGPAIEGGVLRFALPDGRGEGLFAIYFPDLLDRSGKGLGRLNAAVPNEGLFVSGVSVKRADAPSFTSMYLPSRPKGLSRGKVPDVKLRELPEDGEGDLTIWRGKGGSGADGDALGKDLQRLLRADTIDAGLLRDFPKGSDDLVRSLQTSRSDQELLVVGDGWYRTLADGPDAWETMGGKSAHPARYVAFSAPVALADRSGEPVGTVILGGVAFYTPLMLDPDEARRYANKAPTAFFASVARGELPFFRDGDRLWFYRGHLDQWSAGKDRQRRGRAWRARDVPERIKELASQAGSRKLARAAGQPMPMRFEPTPAPEREERGEDAAIVRGRVHDGDIAHWLRHWDRDAELDGPPAVFALASAPGGARFEASFHGAPAPVAAPAPRREGPLLELVDVYAAEPTCVPGQAVIGVVEFVIDSIPNGEEAELELEWSVSAGGPALARLSASLLRVAGEHEVLFEGGCPSNGSAADLGVTLSWPATGLSVAGTASVKVKR